MNGKVVVTHVELQNILGEALNSVLKKDLSPEEREVVNEQSKVILGFANQMINNSNFMLNGEKHLASINNLEQSVVAELIGTM